MINEIVYISKNSYKNIKIMENINQEYLTQLLIKIREQAVIEKANLLYKTHMENVRNLLISGSKLNEMNELYNSIFTSGLTNSNAESNSENKISGEENENKSLNDSCIAASTHSNSDADAEVCNKKPSMKLSPIRFIIEKDKSDDGNKFLEKKNFFIKDVQVEETEKTEKRFVCNSQNCHKEYKSKENLVLHIKNKHNGEKPYFCKFCGKKYSHRSGKTYHEINHHKIKLDVLQN